MMAGPEAASEDVRQATHVLNEAVEKAYRAGLHVQFDVLRVVEFGQEQPIIEVKIYKRM